MSDQQMTLLLGIGGGIFVLVLLFMLFSDDEPHTIRRSPSLHSTQSSSSYRSNRSRSLKKNTHIQLDSPTRASRRSLYKQNRDFSVHIEKSKRRIHKFLKYLCNKESILFMQQLALTSDDNVDYFGLVFEAIGLILGQSCQIRQPIKYNLEPVSDDQILIFDVHFQFRTSNQMYKPYNLKIKTIYVEDKQKWLVDPYFLKKNLHF